MTDHNMPCLSVLEARVVAVLVEKQLATPDYYPLTLNALVAGCNQKSSRFPVLNATDDEVRMALDGLKRYTLVIDSYGASGRVMRFAHNLGKVLALPQPSVALVAVLVLRGPQTAAELRMNCERLHAFADISTVEGYLEEMVARPAGALVVKLPKQPGSREHRYAHLLSGAVELRSPQDLEASVEDVVAHSEIAALKNDVTGLQSEVQALRKLVTRLCAELGVRPE